MNGDDARRKRADILFDQTRPVLVKLNRVHTGPPPSRNGTQEGRLAPRPGARIEPPLSR